MKLQEHIEIVKKIRIPHKKSYTKIILEIAKDHLTESGYLLDPHDNKTRMSIDEFVNAICPINPNPIQPLKNLRNIEQ